MNWKKPLNLFNFVVLILSSYRIKLGEKQYMEAFNSELDAFKERITKRAKEKLQKAMEEYEEVEYFILETDKSLFTIVYLMDKVNPYLKNDLGL